MDLSLEGKNVLIFGAAQGIGKAIADAFREERARVIALDREPMDEADSQVVDISDYKSVAALTERFGREQGPIDHVVCAAACGSGKFGYPFWNLHPDDWDRVFEVTLKGSVNVAHACAPWMREGESDGRTLLFITSVAGQIGSQTDPPYSASKAGLINFMQCAAKDFAPFGIRANALSPGMVKTGLNQSVWASSQEDLAVEEKETYDEWADKKIKTIAPLGRWQEPSEFGAVAVFLASHHARNITGQTINVDGGQVMHC